MYFPPEPKRERPLLRKAKPSTCLPVLQKKLRLIDSTEKALHRTNQSHAHTYKVHRRKLSRRHPKEESQSKGKPTLPPAISRSDVKNHHPVDYLSVGRWASQCGEGDPDFDTADVMAKDLFSCRLETTVATIRKERDVMIQRLEEIDQQIEQLREQIKIQGGESDVEIP